MNGWVQTPARRFNIIASIGVLAATWVVDGQAFGHQTFCADREDLLSDTC
jgi:hypothetical protein